MVTIVGSIKLAWLSLSHLDFVSKLAHLKFYFIRRKIQMVDTTKGTLKSKTYSNDSVSKVVLVKLALYVSVFIFWGS